MKLKIPFWWLTTIMIVLHAKDESGNLNRPEDEEVSQSTHFWAPPPFGHPKKSLLATILKPYLLFQFNITITKIV
ncbi:hypothetical protein CCUS01_17108 [Colletotrichum cuscutae]|uniref:Uncharacterized protein n=1 Tax=Colletotrichum cuscutae TaxID=1209917 RepID=A0AAI9Y568_9PEZI|nr:hypothetical protein CCUS01_17108 [Colletotrichum cuscutae]